MTLHGKPGDTAPTLQEPVLRLLRDLIHERAGIYVEADAFDTLRDRLEPLVRSLQCQSYLDYYYILKYDESGEREWRHVMDAFSVQETYFWREQDQIRALVDHVVPEWFKKNSTPLRIWSAACATGEEPYSLAIALLESGWGAHPITILGSDASEAALARARTGVFRERSFRALPADLRAKYFVAGPTGAMINADLRARVSFRWANLMNLSVLPEADHVEVIFCRNVFIYFSRTSITHVVAAFAARLAPGAPLFIGASESLLNLNTAFDLEEIAGAFVYRRR